MARQCTASGVDDEGAWKCDKPHAAKGLCEGHYARLLRDRPLVRLRRRRKGRKAERHDPNDVLCRIPEGHQRCTDCGDVKPLRQFPKAGRGLLSGHCRECSKDRHLETKFGRGAAAFKRRKLAENGHKCGRCGRTTPSAAGNREWHLDHDHNYAKNDPNGWRNVLCHYCNFALGCVEIGGWDAIAFAASLENDPPSPREPQ